MLMVAGCCAHGGVLRGAEAVDYARQIHPLLVARCVECHGPDDQNGDLRLDSLAAMLRGGNSGPAVVPGQAGQSLLIRAVTGDPDVTAMPPEGEKLASSEVRLLREWIDQGARGPAAEPPIASERRSSDHWAFQPVARPHPPDVKNAVWVRNPVDRFVLARLEAARLAPSPEADRATLIRRLSLDLIGLPPAPDEVTEFLADKSPDSYERLVDRLLASLHYGERWGRHWLDLARYADSNGYTIDSGRSIWKYRDWVINSLNRDLPFDQFVIEQLAGDLLPKATSDQLVATGFHRNTMKNEEGGTDQEQFRVEAVADRVATTGSVFLGLTLGCARCHDHKYDPISQREFYQLFAFFNDADDASLSLPTDQQARERPALLAEIKGVEERLATVLENSSERQLEWEQKILAQFRALEQSGESPELAAALADLAAALAAPVAERSAEQKQQVEDEFRRQDVERKPLEEALADLKTQLKRLDSATTTTLVMRPRKEPRETFVHVRGDFLRHGAKVDPDVPQVLPPLEAAGRRPTRLDLARWLVDPANPLTARVSVNRVWQQYFGHGLVATENDFGTQGEPPTHPELLDWLAGEFIRSGWSLKALHKTIVTSAAYRQSSHWRSDLAAVDPYNKLLGRQERLRLEAEVIRDSALAASGLLNPEIGGPGVYPPQPEGVFRFTQRVKYWKESEGPDRFRRGIYTYFWRSSPYPLLTLFDAPDATTACTRRIRSNTPLQALTLANDRAFVEMAQGLAARILREGPKDELARLDYAFSLCLARKPTACEREYLASYLRDQHSSFEIEPKQAKVVAPANVSAGVEPAEAAAWTAVARVLLNLDEFITRE